jgi:hypothetical protein
MRRQKDFVLNGSQSERANANRCTINTISFQVSTRFLRTGVEAAPEMLVSVSYNRWSPESLYYYG